MPVAAGQALDDRGIGRPGGEPIELGAEEGGQREAARRPAP
jgi:hypothetical protein